tara:strand:- start:271 stop:663 length:393 start_codon:yes stop_codon:yes gene_type:complete
MKNFQDFLLELNRFEKEKGTDTKTGKPITKGGTKKPVSTTKDAVLDAVKKSITDKYGKGAFMRSGSNQQKKIKGQKTDGEGKYLKQHKANQQLKKDAKEMGYGDNTKGYVETRARYGSKENMKSGKGLGT